jgi:hypothetical protein
MIQQEMVNAVTTETECSYCKQKNHTIEMCKNKKFYKELKDKVTIIVPSLVKNHKALQDLLQQKERLSNDLEKVVRSTLKTFQGLTICGINMRDRTSPRMPMGKLPSSLGKINRKTRHLSRSLLMTREARPEQIWYATKNTSKQQRDMLDFT